MKQEYQDPAAAGHPITPPPVLVRQWLGDYFGTTVTGEVSGVEAALATQAAAWAYQQAMATIPERQATLQPVPVAVRLPGPGDCAPWPKESDVSAWCWVGSKVDGGWIWEQRSAGCLAAFPDDYTHWLPAHALPLPAPQGGEVKA